MFTIYFALFFMLNGNNIDRMLQQLDQVKHQQSYGLLYGYQITTSFFTHTHVSHGRNMHFFSSDFRHLYIFIVIAVTFSLSYVIIAYIEFHPNNLKIPPNQISLRIPTIRLSQTSCLANRVFFLFFLSLVLYGSFFQSHGHIFHYEID